MQRNELVGYLDTFLETARFRDYCPNGLQVEGKSEIRRVVCGVTASQVLIEIAVAKKADALLVHHGWFWRGEEGRVTGFRKQRMATLLAHDINLIAFHLPLDAHPIVGNNVQLAAQLDWCVEGRFGEQELVCVGRASTQAAMTVADLAAKIDSRLARAPLLIGDPTQVLHRIAWCSGGAQGYFEQAIAMGVDCYISGEISEQTVHLARESGVAYLAIGHHASERYGVQALGQHLHERFGLDCEFVDVDNPV